MRSAVGGIDAGGTTWACAIGTSPDEIFASAIIPTTTPEETLERVAAFFNDWIAQGNQLRGVGVSCFGPLIRDPSHPHYGCIAETPKPGWSHAAVGPTLRTLIGTPVAIDTDVNGAALAEGEWGMARGLNHYAYLTIGTGIGGAIVANGKLANGIAHPELGHIRPRRIAGDSFAGCCAFHGDCYEGLASGTAIRARTGRDAVDLPANDPRWDYVSTYIGSLCANLILGNAPERIILGGSIMRKAGLIEAIRKAAAAEILPYLATRISGQIDGMITRTGWVSDEGPAHFNAGIGGGFLLARSAN